MENTLQTIIDFADKAHDEQTRKYTPERYIVHPVRVMKICQPYTTNKAMLAAAILNDVLEDTPVTPEEMHAFLRSVFDDSTAKKLYSLLLS